MLCCSKECTDNIKKIIYLDKNNPNYNNRGDKNSLHKNNERVTKHGYRLIFIGDKHPFAIDKYWIREHRYVAEKYLMTDEQSIYINGQKYLNPIYDVHHKDFNRLNNSVDNLEIMLRSDHIKLHHQLKHNNYLNQTS